MLFFVTQSGFAQKLPEGKLTFPGGGAVNEAEFKDQQEKMMSMLQQKAPKLYQFQKRLMEIQEETQRLLTGAMNDDLPKAQVEEQLRALIKEKVDIEENKEYKVEKEFVQMIMMSNGMKGRPMAGGQKPPMMPGMPR